MQQIRNKYNPAVAHHKAELALKDVPLVDVQAWLNHSCTKSLRYTIEAAMDEIVLNWVKADFTSNQSLESLALSQSRYTGVTSTLENILDYIERMPETAQRENDEIIDSTAGKAGNY